MFRQSARDTTLLARVVEHSKCVFQLQMQRTKIIKSKGEKIKARRTEDKALFGKLVETKKQKVKRLRYEAQGLIPKSEPSTTNSEVAWLMNGLASGLKKINIKKPIEAVKQNQSIDANSNVSIDKQTVQKSPREVQSESVLKEDSVNTSVTKDKPSESKKNSLLSPTVIEKLLDYPIVETYKSPDDKWSVDSKIMSLSAMDERSCLKYPSVTKILTATMTDEAKAVLERWKMNMIEKLGEKGFELYKAELLSDGKLFHASVMNKLTNKPFAIPDRIKNAYQSLSQVLDDVNQVRAVESHVIHPILLYRGIVDCIAVYRDSLCCIDWKKSDKTKDTLGSTYDAPLQLASYIGALNADLKYPFQIKKGMIIVAYTNGDAAKIHEISEDSLQLYWRLWLQRLQEYHIALNA